MWWQTAYLGSLRTLPAQVYQVGQCKGALRVPGHPCGMGWEFRGLYCGSGNTWTCPGYGGASACSSKLPEDAGTRHQADHPGRALQQTKDLVRQLPEGAESDSASQHAAPGLQQHAQPSSAGYTCHQAYADQQVCLDQLLIRCQHLVSRVPAVCTCQDSVTQEGGSGSYSGTLAQVLNVHVDLVGPWPWTAEGHTHLLTIVDRTTRWAEAIPLQSTTAQVVAYSFVVNWMARTREPSSPVLHGSACGQACADDCIPPPVKQYGEAFLQLKAALHARCSGAAWLEHLPWVLLGLRASPKYETGVSSAEATYGHSPMLPSQL